MSEKRCPICDRADCPMLTVPDLRKCTHEHSNERLACYACLDAFEDVRWPAMADCEHHAINWRDRCLAAEADRDNLRTFARWVLRGYDGGEIGNIDGGELQDEAVRLGLLVPASECDGDCDGECTCLTLADVLKNP